MLALKRIVKGERDVNHLRRSAQNRFTLYLQSIVKFQNVYLYVYFHKCGHSFVPRVAFGFNL